MYRCVSRGQLRRVMVRPVSSRAEHSDMSRYVRLVAEAEPDLDLATGMEEIMGQPEMQFIYNLVYVNTRLKLFNQGYDLLMGMIFRQITCVLFSTSKIFLKMFYHENLNRNSRNLIFSLKLSFSEEKQLRLECFGEL